VTKHSKYDICANRVHHLISSFVFIPRTTRVIRGLTTKFAMVSKSNFCQQRIHR